LKPIDTIILVDDEEAVNFLNKTILRKQGISDKILDFQRAEDALNYLKKMDDPNEKILILLDINMPIMNGWDFLRIYESMRLNEKINPVIIMLTSSIDPYDYEKAKSFEFVNDYRTKPLNVSTTEGIIQKFFS
jgi:CheY-like chemotaxis protein